MQSEITGRYIIFQSCNRHRSHSGVKNTWIRNNQFQEDDSHPPSEEVLISIMKSIKLDDVDSMEVGPSTDQLGMEQSIQACSTTISTDKDQFNGQDNSHQNNSDLLPFDPDFQEADAEPIISNLPQLKDCEFDHNYILHHLEQLEIDPTLC